MRSTNRVWMEATMKSSSTTRTVSSVVSIRFLGSAEAAP